MGDLVLALPSIRVVVYEDGSDDGTQSLLAALIAEFPAHVRTVSEKVDWSFKKSQVRTWDNKPCRIECIAAARNRLMELLETEGMGELPTDLCLMVDPDMPIKTPVDRILHRLMAFPDEADALFANGISGIRGGAYYDMFAYRDDRFPMDADVLGEEGWTDRQRVKGQTVGVPIPFNPPFPRPIPVWSAFGGLAIYRATSIKGKRYSAFPTGALNSLYRKFAAENPGHPDVQQLRASQSRAKTHHHGSLLGLHPFEKREDGGLFYFNCHGYNAPIVCEHIPFHAEMMTTGSRGRLWIDPALVYISDH